MDIISITDSELTRIVALLKDEYGINLSRKKNLVVGRLQNYLHISGFKSFSEFYEYVLADKTGEAITLLINKLTTNYTFFMRESDHFDFFKNTVLPYIKENEKSRDMRVWSAGCSSGEEPYSIVMCIDEFFAGNKNGWDTKILATDISERVLDLAAEGVYLTEATEKLPQNWRRNYFTKNDGNYSQVIGRLREEIVFRKFNLMEKKFPCKKKFHSIWCGNVMIYFDARTKNEITEKFYEVTEPGGYLFIGHSESLPRWETRYSYVKPAVYRKDR